MPDEDVNGFIVGLVIGVLVTVFALAFTGTFSDGPVFAEAICDEKNLSYDRYVYDGGGSYRNESMTVYCKPKPVTIPYDGIVIEIGGLNG